MKIKVIDLLNKIANGEEVPEKIKINNVIYEYRGYMYCTEKANYQNIEDYLFGKWNFNILNDYAEIIEEPKKIEKIKSNGDEFYSDYIDTWISKNKTDAYCEFLMNKINELIDVVNELKRDK